MSVGSEFVKDINLIYVHYHNDHTSVKGRMDMHNLMIKVHKKALG